MLRQSGLTDAGSTTCGIAPPMPPDSAKSDLLDVIRDIRDAQTRQHEEVRSDLRAINPRLGQGDTLIALLNQKLDTLSGRIDDLSDRAEDHSQRVRELEGVVPADVGKRVVALELAEATRLPKQHSTSAAAAIASFIAIICGLAWEIIKNAIKGEKP